MQLLFKAATSQHALYLLLLFFIFGCTNPPYRGECLANVDEFVMDSYRIREGKWGILEMEGHCVGSLTANLLEEYDVSAECGRVELIGEVALATLPVDGRLRLFEALALAKIPPTANLFKSYVVRDNRLLPVDINRLVREGDMTQNIVMRAGDKIFIAQPSASNVMVLGEVGMQRIVDAPSGALSLKQVIAEAGGLTLFGDRRYIQVIRGNLIQPKIYTLHWDHMMELPSASLLVMAGDIVYVAATPLAEWSRFVNQILPTLISFDLVTKGIKSVGVNVNN